MELMDRIWDALRTPETGEGASDFVVAGVSLVGRDLEEVSLDANPPGPVSLETVLVRVIRLVHHESRSAEGLGKERLGRVSGELFAQLCRLKKERGPHVLEKDGARRLDEFAPVVTPDEEQIHLRARLEHARQLAHRQV